MEDKCLFDSLLTELKSDVRQVIVLLHSHTIALLKDETTPMMKKK